MAIEARSRAYAPYSRYTVGAAVRTRDGRAFTGANVENASYGLGLCAECGLVSALHSSGGPGHDAVTCVPLYAVSVVYGAVPGIELGSSRIDV